MYLCDFSLNNLSLMALTIATGFVVDDAIVVLENISRHVEAGMKPKSCAHRRTRSGLHCAIDESVVDRCLHPITIDERVAGTSIP